MIGDVLAPTHLLLILLVALLVLGPKRLPEVGRSLGKGLRDFREAMSSYSPDALLNSEEAAPPARAAAAATAPPSAATATAAPVQPASTSPSTTAAPEPPDAEVVPASQHAENSAG